MKFIVFLIPIFIFGARPLITDDTGCVEKGIFEFEAGIWLIKTNDWSKEVYFQLKHGLTDRFDIGVSIPYDFESFKKSEMNFKYAILLDSQRFPDISLSLLNLLSNDFGLNLILSKDFRTLIIHFNVGYVFNDKIFSSSFAFEYPLRERYTLCFDFLIKTQDDFEFTGLTGIRFNIFESLFLDFGFSLNNNKGLNITTGLTYNF